MVKNSTAIKVTKVYKGKQKSQELLSDIVLTMLLEEDERDEVLS